MKNYTIKPRGFEQSAIVMSGTNIVAEVFTDTEPADQHQTAALFAAAPDMLEALQAIRMRLATGSSHRMGTMIDEIAVIARATGG